MPSWTLHHRDRPTRAASDTEQSCAPVQNRPHKTRPSPPSSHCARASPPSPSPRTPQRRDLRRPLSSSAQRPPLPMAPILNLAHRRSPLPHGPPPSATPTTESLFRHPRRPHVDYLRHPGSREFPSTMRPMRPCGHPMRPQRPQSPPHGDCTLPTSCVPVPLPSCAPSLPPSHSQRACRPPPTTFNRPTSAYLFILPVHPTLKIGGGDDDRPTSCYLSLPKSPAHGYPLVLAHMAGHPQQTNLRSKGVFDF